MTRVFQTIMIGALALSMGGAIGCEAEKPAGKTGASGMDPAKKKEMEESFQRSLQNLEELVKEIKLPELEAL